MKAISSKVILEVSRYRYFLSKLLKNFRKHLMTVICLKESYYDCFELKEKLWLVFFPPGGNLGYQRQSGQRGISLVRDTVLPFFLDLCILVFCVFEYSWICAFGFCICVFVFYKYQRQSSRQRGISLVTDTVLPSAADVSSDRSSLRNNCI